MWNGLTYRAAGDEPVEEMMQLVGLDEQLIHRHLARGRVPGHERHRLDPARSSPRSPRHCRRPAQTRALLAQIRPPKPTEER